ncbi:MAG: alpha/beta fold hydrolase [Gammaproteobacteria bacterium]|nr:alpha/beta fold hydrolase [Gammaproteobacteria bacterium]
MVATSLDAVIINPAKASAAVIWLHGLGADGHDFEPIVDELQFAAKPHTRFIFPHAPPRPVSINGGHVMRAWYDIYTLGIDVPQDEAGIRAAASRVNDYVNVQHTQGIDYDRIVLAGFSQGGAIALHAGLRFPQQLAGILALSTYLPMPAALTTELHKANRSTPIWMAHGQVDTVIPLQVAEHSCKLLQQQGCPIQWHSYSMGHGVCPQEVVDISRWLSLVLSTKA